MQQNGVPAANRQYDPRAEEAAKRASAAVDGNLIDCRDLSQLARMRENAGKPAAYQPKNYAIQASFTAGMMDLAVFPVQFIYDLFMEGEHDPEKASNGVDKIFRIILQNNDDLHAYADSEIAKIDDSTIGGYLTKNVIAPLAEMAPGVILDMALIYGTGGTGYIVLKGGRVLDGMKVFQEVQKGGKALQMGSGVAQKVLGDVSAFMEQARFVANQPITATRATMYAMQEFSRQKDAGATSPEAAVSALSYGLGFAMLEGFTLANMPKLGDMGQSNLTKKDLQKIAIDFSSGLTMSCMEGMVKKSIDEMEKQQSDRVKIYY